jgi:hypothetical protein
MWIGEDGDAPTPQPTQTKQPGIEETANRNH